MYKKPVESKQRGIQLQNDSDTLELFKKKYFFIQCFRNYMLNHNAIEVEVPYLNAYREGAPLGQYQTIDPVTNERLFLRHSPENHLRRIVHPFRHVFEIGKNFRVEREDEFHANEFLVLEEKSAEHGYIDGMNMVIELIQTAVHSTFDSLDTGHVDVSSFQFIDFETLLKEFTGLSLNEEYKEKALQLLEKYELPISDELYDWEVLELIQKYYIEPNLISPSVITNFPQPLQHFSPCGPDSNKYERFSIIIKGIEICDGGTKFDNAHDYRMVFEENKDYAVRYMGMSDFIVSPEMYSDVDFVKEKVFSFGLGIDRLFAMCVGKKIHDVILFPYR